MLTLWEPRCANAAIEICSMNKLTSRTRISRSTMCVCTHYRAIIHAPSLAMIERGGDEARSSRPHGSRIEVDNGAHFSRRGCARQPNDRRADSPERRPYRHQRRRWRERGRGRGQHATGCDSDGSFAAPARWLGGHPAPESQPKRARYSGYHFHRAHIAKRHRTCHDGRLREGDRQTVRDRLLSGPDRCSAFSEAVREEPGALSAAYSKSPSELDRLTMDERR